MRRLLTLLPFILLLSGIGAAAPFDVDQESQTVAAIRQQTFRTPVPQQSMSRSAFRFFLRNQLERGTNLRLERFFEVLGALQLIEPHTTVDSILDLYESQVLAFYDPATHKYYDVSPPPANLPLSSELSRLVTIHELTHALQDQRFDAGKKLDALRNDWDAQMAYQSVLEGEATLVMFAALYQSTGRELSEALASDELVSTLSEMAASNAGIDPKAPPYFVESMKFPYVQGVAFVVQAYRRGGWKELDKVHENPPISTAQIIDPSLYFSDGGKKSAVVSASKSALLTTSLGQFHWQFLLGEETARGWASDVVTVSDAKGGSLNVSVESTWKSKADAARFASSYAAFLEKRGLKPAVSTEGVSVHVEYAAPPWPRTAPAKKAEPQPKG